LLFVFDIKNKDINIAHAENSQLEDEVNQNIDKIVGDIDTGEFDEYLFEGASIFEISSFKDLVDKILSGELFLDYNSIFDFFKSNFISSFKQIFSFVLILFSIVVLYQIFSNLCADKYKDLNKTVKFIFSLVIIFSLFSLVSSMKDSITNVVDKIFKFSNILFPILLSLMLSSGAVGSFSVYSALSAFVLNSGMYVFVYILLPLAIAILILSIFGNMTSNNKLSKLVGLLKYVFKIIVSAIFVIFGMFSIINVVSSGMKDGLSIKITKYAIKNYIPILGGYISEGFDFVKTCSVLVKNAFGIGGIFVLFFMIIQPLIIYLVYIFCFKILSFLTSFIGENSFANIFEDVSKSFAFLLAVLVGCFLIMLIFIYLTIMSVSAVWLWFISLQ